MNAPRPTSKLPQISARVQGRSPGNFIAFVALDDEPEVRIRHRWKREGLQWNCDAHGQTRYPNCDHAMVAYELAVTNFERRHP